MSDVVHCPECGQEYDAAAVRPRCVECGHRLAPGPALAPEAPPPDPLDATGDVVELASSRTQADVRVREGIVREAGVPTRVATAGADDLGVYGGTPDPIHVLFVPREREEEARRALAEARAEPSVEEAIGADREPDGSAVWSSDDRARVDLRAPVGAIAVSILFVGAVSFFLGPEPPRPDETAIGIVAGEEDWPPARIGGLAVAALIGGVTGVRVARSRRATFAVVLLLLATPVATWLLIFSWILG